MEQDDLQRARDLWLALSSELPREQGEHVQAEVALECLDRLSQLDSATTAAMRLQLINRYENAREADVKQRLNRHEAAALSDAGQTNDSIEAARQCVKVAPRSPIDQLLLAKCLLASTASEHQQAAADVATKLITGTQKGSANWFEAKLLLAEAWIKMNDLARADRLLRLTAALHPNWGGKKTKARYESWSGS